MIRLPGKIRSVFGVLMLIGALTQFLHPDITQARRSRARSAEIPVHETLLEGRVVRVSDGDTLVVLEEVSGAAQKQGGSSLQQVKVRLDGMDAPEKSQPFGEFCRKKLADRVAGKQVKVSVRKLDRYGRSLGTVGVSGVANVNLEQVKEGCGWFYRQFAREHPESVRKEFEDAEAQAKKRKIGLWQDPNPTPPWEFRREKKQRSRKDEDEF